MYTFESHTCEACSTPHHQTMDIFESNEHNYCDPCRARVNAAYGDYRRMAGSGWTRGGGSAAIKAQLIEIKTQTERVLK
jgi:hypothetical protein